MKPGLGRWVAGARELLRPGGLDKLKHRLEDRVMNAVMQATRLTNDGGYRRYRDDPTARGELTAEAKSPSGAGSAPEPGATSETSAPEPGGTSETSAPEPGATSESSAPGPGATSEAEAMAARSGRKAGPESE